MELSVEISYYPLKNDYKPPIRKLIEQLRRSGLEVHSNRISTQLFGEYDTVMATLSRLMKWSFENQDKGVFVAKFMEGDRRPRTGE